MKPPLLDCIYLYDDQSACIFAFFGAYLIGGLNPIKG